MGYESRIIVGEKTEFENSIFFDKLVEINLSCMGYETVHGRTFHGLFKKEIDFNLVVDHDFTKEDDYGATCRYTDLNTVIKWLRASQTAKEYRRAKMLLKLLEGMKKCEADYNNVCVVHYGY